MYVSGLTNSQLRGETLVPSRRSRSSANIETQIAARPLAVKRRNVVAMPAVDEIASDPASRRDIKT